MGWGEWDGVRVRELPADNYAKSIKMSNAQWSGRMTLSSLFYLFFVFLFLIFLNNILNNVFLFTTKPAHNDIFHSCNIQFKVILFMSFIKF